MHCIQVRESSKIAPSEESISQVTKLFQPAPTYIEKHQNRDWKTIHGSLGGEDLNTKVFQHLSTKHSLSLGTLARWYPNYLELDIDHGGLEMCNMLQKNLKLDDSQVQVYRTEREGGFRMRCRVSQTTTSTREYFYQKLRFLEDAYGAEVYPRASRHVRLPFDSKLTPVGRLQNSSVNELVQDFLHLSPLDLESFDWPNAEWTSPEETKFRRSFVGEYSYGRGEESLLHGLSGPGARYTAQWDMMRVLRKRGYTAVEAIDHVFDVLKTKGHFSKDIKGQPAKVYQELSWCANALWNGESVTDHIRQDAIKIWSTIAGPNFAFLRFCLGVVSYLTARHEVNRWIPLPRKMLLTFAHPRNVSAFLQKLIDFNFIERDDSYSVGRKSKAVRVLQPELLGTLAPLFVNDIFPAGGLEALQLDTDTFTTVYTSLSSQEKRMMTRAL